MSVEETSEGGYEQPQTQASSKSGFKKFVESMMVGLGNLTRLEIKTLVGDEFTVIPDSVDPKNPLKANYRLDTDARDAQGNSKVQGMTSDIQLISGDITTRLTKSFADGTYQELRDFHSVKETQGQDIIKKNLEVIAKIGEVLKGLISSDEEVNGKS
ncbi:MAG TPA: hypothetical protein DCE41_04225 [Cytophagales bacterium]|nr:hypothetical protein [Cytophagales bacterium]HAA20527.1 hypothetical protein [Cytophagales bacterium]HAP61491.1 hypothetical protein [Cytophagales bacterium]